MYENNPIKNTFKNKYLTGEYFSKFTHELVWSVEEKQLHYLPKKQFISAYIRYPDIPWSKKANVFAGLEPKFIQGLQDKKYFFVIDASEEGYCPITAGWFDAFYNTFNLYKIDPKQIIFTSSNLKDEINMKKYAETQGVDPMHIVIWNKFELHTELNLQDNTDQHLKYIIKKTNAEFTGKYLFSSLSRISRPHKTLMQFLLWHKCKKYARLSHDVIPDLPNFNNFEIKKFSQSDWLNELPLIADYDDFSVNWACFTPFEHLHTESLFQIVNESDYGWKEGTSTFYSEKTFMAMSCFTPFIINSSQGINHYLKDIGYKLYDDWFEYEFDFEEDYEVRCLMISDQVKALCKKLSKMSKTEKIDWKFKNTEVLKHNYNTLKERKFSIEKINKIIDVLEKQVTPSAT